MSSAGRRTIAGIARKCGFYLLLTSCDGLVADEVSRCATQTVDDEDLCDVRDDPSDAHSCDAVRPGVGFTWSGRNGGFSVCTPHEQSCASGYAKTESAGAVEDPTDCLRPCSGR